MEPLARPRLIAVLTLLAGLAATIELSARGSDPLPSAGSVLFTMAAVAMLPRLAPWAAGPVVASMVLATSATPDGGNVTANLLALLGVVFRTGEAWSTLACLRTLAFIVVTGQIATIAAGEWYPGDILFGTTVYALPMLLGRVVGSGRAAQAELEARTAELERERARRATLEAEAERARVAGQVNGVITDALRAMVEAADRGLAGDAARSLGAIEETGRAALVDVRRLLGVLRDEERETA